MAMLDRSFWERLKQTVDDVGGCNTGADTGITVARGGGGMEVLGLVELRPQPLEQR